MILVEAWEQRSLTCREAWTKWLPWCRQQFEMPILEYIYIYLYSVSLWGFKCQYVSTGSGHSLASSRWQTTIISIKDDPVHRFAKPQRVNPSKLLRKKWWTDQNLFLRLEYHRVDSQLAPSQWEMVLLYNNVSHWLGTNLESALISYQFWLLESQSKASTKWMIFCRRNTSLDLTA